MRAERERGLEWTVVGESRNGNDEEVKEKVERGETDGNAGDNLFHEEEVFGEDIADEEKSGLEHGRQTLHDEIEVPSVHSTNLALLTPTAVNDRSTRLHLGIMVEPLLAQRGDKCGEGGSGQTCVKDGLDFDNGGIRASPLRANGGGTSWGMPKRDVGDNLEAVAQLCVIRLEIVLNVDNENGRNYGEQTGLFPRETYQYHCQGGCGKSIHEDQRDVRIRFISQSLCRAHRPCLEACRGTRRGRL